MLVGNCSFERECSAISATTSARVWVFSYVPSMGFCLFPGFSKIIQICSQYVIVKVQFYDLNSQPLARVSSFSHQTYSFCLTFR